MKIIDEKCIEFNIGDPLLVDQETGEPDVWSPYPITEEAIITGRYKMPKIYRMPGGELYLTYSMSIEHYYDLGRVSPVFVSKDEGRTWEKTNWPHPGFMGYHPLVSPIFEGEYYCMPTWNGIRLDVLEMPKPMERTQGGMDFKAYRLADCPREVYHWYRNLKALRWSEKTGWVEEDVNWDHEGQYIYSVNDKRQNIPGDWGQKTYIAQPVLLGKNELYAADYWTTYENPPGQIPRYWECSFMVSTDNARSWKRRSTIASSLSADSSDPGIVINQAGDIVCVMRSEPFPSKMYLTHSKDRGYTWSEPENLFSYGVFPHLLQLGNGIIVLSYGRAPGTWISFSPDGGYSWIEPKAILDETGKPSSDGYVSLLAMGYDSFLLAYGDIHFADATGVERKSLLLRKVTVNYSKNGNVV